MFHCQKCRGVSEPGEKMHRRVTVTRDKQYVDTMGQPISVGSEIVQESAWCKYCANGERRPLKLVMPEPEPPTAA
jgi:hypothetical protein